MEEEKKKKVRSVVYITLFLLVVAIFIGYLIVTWGAKEEPISEQGIEQFAKCLRGEGVVLYVLDSCSFCAEQKAMFGDYFDTLDYIKCNEQSEVCQATGIKAVPAWKFPNGSISTGVHSFELLSQMTGCNYE